MSTIRLTNKPQSAKPATIQKQRKLRGHAREMNRRRPKHNRVDRTFADIYDRLLSYMNPEVGNLSWVSHRRLARELGMHFQTVAAHLKAAVLLGYVRVRYHTAAAAHKQISERHPDYPKHTGGLTFSQMLSQEPGNPKTLNYYTIQDCLPMDGQLLPGWQLEVIRLCTTKKTEDYLRAKELAAQHTRVLPPKQPVRTWQEVIGREAQALGRTVAPKHPEPTASGPSEPSLSATVHGTQTLLSTKEDGLRHREVAPSDPDSGLIDGIDIHQLLRELDQSDSPAANRGTNGTAEYSRPFTPKIAHAVATENGYSCQEEGAE